MTCTRNGDYKSMTYNKMSKEELENVLDNVGVIMENEVKKYFKSIDFQPLFMWQHQMYIECFKNISFEKQYRIFGYNNPSDLEKQKIKDAFKSTIKTYEEVVLNELDKVVKFYMTNSSVSQWEASIFAEKHFSKEVGFLNTFMMVLNLNIFITRTFL